MMLPCEMQIHTYEILIRALKVRLARLGIVCYVLHMLA